MNNLAPFKNYDEFLRHQLIKELLQFLIAYPELQFTTRYSYYKYSTVLSRSMIFYFAGLYNNNNPNSGVQGYYSYYGIYLRLPAITRHMMTLHFQQLKHTKVKFNKRSVSIVAEKGTYIPRSKNLFTKINNLYFKMHGMHLRVALSIVLNPKQSYEYKSNLQNLPSRLKQSQVH